MTKSPNRLLGTVFGAVYILVGLLGFTVTNGVGFFATEGGLLLGLFEVNIFHNVAHLLIGAALLLAGLSNVKAARTVNSVVGFAYLALGFLGLFLVGSALNILALNAADNVLHFASAVVLLAVGLGADKRASSVTA
ncbi:DUF4383 domain-containing protein [Salinibacterium sp. NSLL150]|uniref:DUF4383 domain-containing protein n=1 Tax=unclassified Salinibacterium TaxID=2632331 RepID=UPI0018CD37C5|nr:MULTISPECIES: DUF4383 domain-containing protein [unclassified Salinibacterium]MBH0097810.1 DUF4383 domain-containing protein [Salinibacterium sp. NSLL35]MBH0100565.1 DUF4383 domain-containing protein [Salinibacterium sp. NSLL150]MBH0103324.1 DUF4383 domain-containing protein [Salinibacterium sp. NSLL16]MBH0106085.1 DUF4383 domain-containing protein [Salinibacterium sp. NSLL17]MBH0110138.1 DUF4383 domain-containing protein [Salinibacterium sp. NG22]